MSTTPQEQNSSTRKWLYWLFFAGLVALRLLLPGKGNDNLLAHRAIVDSLLSAHNWGRQALVGSLEYPPLTTFGLLVGQCLPLVGNHAAKLLVAVCQVWTAFNLLRFADDRRRRLGIVLLLLLSLASSEFRNTLLTLDPNWIIAVPLTAALRHLIRWQRDKQTRDYVLLSGCCGILVFAGLGGTAAAALLLALTGNEMRKPGQRLLLWTPFLYCLCLWFLWNWLIMGNPVFFLSRFAEAARGLGLTAIIERSTGAISEISWYALIPSIAIIFSVPANERSRTTATLILASFIGLLLARILSFALVLNPAGTGIAGIILGAAAFSFALRELHSKNRRGILVASAAFVVAVIIGDLNSVVSLETEAQFTQNAPPASEITQLIDKYWPDSRIAVHGVRACAIYHDPKEKRFVNRMDFYEGVFLKQAEDEQMHLLIPPIDGTFHAPGTTVFDDIRRNGRSWLLLEKQWASGWQLWRCVIAPKGESRLQSLQ